MKRYTKITPEGTKDFLFAECSAMDDVCGKVETVFRARGFKKVITPAIEFYDIFALPCSGIMQEAMFKTVDNKGRLLVVRPDSTLPIARMTSTRLKNSLLPLRLYYKQAVYRNNPTLTGRSSENMQMGVELLGVRGIRADLEVLTTAVSAVSSVAEDFRIELGHAGVFDALSENLEIDDNYKEKIRVSIEGKNYSALNNLLDKLQPSKAVSAIRSLPSLFGGDEVFDKAREICRGTKAEDALEYLHKIYTNLSSLGLGEKIIVDLGLVQRNDYYTGIVFSGYISGIGDAVLSGGRYDELLGEFDLPMGAAGFAIDTDAVTMKRLSDENISYSDNPDVLVFAADGYEMQAISEVERLNAEGVKAQFSVLPTLEETQRFARERGIPQVKEVK
ncbi:MAG TPA: ATP phosphoribosyltransferase regulatory subunit [Ruminococcaceae bacterium]|nr:ATP phosphoribosyltransferase regulatory subunit [Oscillospiraceae bacterium]